MRSFRRPWLSWPFEPSWLSTSSIAPRLTLVVGAALAISCGEAPDARSLFVIGDSYAHTSARYLIPLARSVGCDVRIVNVTEDGVSAAQLLAARRRWLPRLERVPAPTLVYATFGLNDLYAAEDEPSPEAAARVAGELIEVLRAAAAPAGGEVVFVSYDDIWSLPPHSVRFEGREEMLRSEASGLLEAFYERLPTGSEGVRFLDVRGWLGDALWTKDGIHLLHENYRAQAELLWNREFAARFGCESTDGAASAG